jgi:hypothetical protein
MSELSNLTPEQQEQYNKLLQEITQNIDPTEYLPPSIREVARMDMDTLKQEFDLVVAKQSTRSSNQRKWILERFEHEFNKQHEPDGTTK